MVVGVDTHADVHVAAVLSSLGARLGSTVVATTPTGFGELVGWARGVREDPVLRCGGNRELRGSLGPASASRGPHRGGGGPPRPEDSAPAG